MNQITENIACNSELYSHILDTSANNNRLYKVLNNIATMINNSNHIAQTLDEIIPTPKICIDHIERSKCWRYSQTRRKPA